MKLISWNVNGLRAVRKKGFEQFIQKQKPDVICLQETKVGEDKINEVDMSIKGYSESLASAKKPGYSGVGTYLKEGLKAKKSLNQIGIKEYDQEGRVVISEIEDLLLYNIYFPSGTTGELRQNFKYKFLDDVFAHIKKLPKSKRERLIICGDFNICHKEIDIHHPEKATKQEMSGFLPEERAWLDKFSELGFVDSFRHVHGQKTDKYSWWSYRAGARDKNLGWRIDYFWLAEPLAKRIKDAEILGNTPGSDHAPVVLEIENA